MTTLSTLCVVIDWTCESCGRRGVAVVDRNDQKTPGERAYQSHQAQQPTHHLRLFARCLSPSLTWRRRPMRKDVDR